jgi:hypothetical protein
MGGRNGNGDRGDDGVAGRVRSRSGGSASRLYPDLADLRGTDYMNAAIEETGAVVMGRRTFDMGDPDSSVDNLRVPGADLRGDAPSTTIAPAVVGTPG